MPENMQARRARPVCAVLPNKEAHIVKKRDQQKALVLALRNEGKSYAEIAQMTGESEGNCRTICSRHARKYRSQFPKDTCRNCGKPLTYTPGAKKKLFCDDKCRLAFNNEQHRHEAHISRCAWCGLDFVAFGIYGSKKLYCSRECKGQAARLAHRNAKAS